MTEELKQILKRTILHCMFCGEGVTKIALEAVLASQGMPPGNILFNGVGTGTITIRVLYFDDEKDNFNIVIETSGVDFIEGVPTLSI